MEPLPHDSSFVPRLLARHARAVRWTKILAAYFSTQSLAQLLTLGAGLLFIRFMPVREFALYTLASSFVGFFTFVSDLGSSGSLVYFFHRCRSEGGAFEPYLAAVGSLRKAAFLLGALAVLGAFPWVSAAKGFALSAALTSALAILATVWFQIRASLELQVLRLEGHFAESYRAEVAGGATRFALALALVAFAYLSSWAAVATSAAALVVVSRLARAPVAPAAIAAPLAPYRRQVLRYLLPTLPAAAYFSIQAPLAVWLAATFGSTQSLAEVGALARLGMILGLFSNLVGVVFLPRLARVTDERRYLRLALAFGGLLALVGAGLAAVAWAAPRPFLALLGPHYRGLASELVLVVSGAALNLLGGYAVGINNARSWNRLQGLAVVLLIAAQALLAASLPLETTAGVLWFNVGTAAVGLALQGVSTALGFLRPKWVHWQ